MVAAGLRLVSHITRDEDQSTAPVPECNEAGAKDTHLDQVFVATAKRDGVCIRAIEGSLVSDEGLAAATAEKHR